MFEELKNAENKVVGLKQLLRGLHFFEPFLEGFNAVYEFVILFFAHFDFSFLSDFAVLYLPF